MAIERSIYIPLMSSAVEQGVSFNKFQADLIAHGMGKARAALLSVWQDVQGMVKNRAIMAQTASDEYPTLTDVSKGPFRYTKEFVYKAEVQFQLGKRGPKESMFVTILSEEQLTKGEITEQVRSKWTEWESGQQGRLLMATPITAIHWIGE